MSHLDFTLALLRAVAPDPAEQVCWSPFSVASALGLLAEGARGDTRAELTALLGDLDELHGALAGATEPDDGEDRMTLAVANTLWVDPAIRVEEGFASRMSGGVRAVSFRDDTEGARRTINADVAETTRQLIDELLKPGDVRATTVSALVNALYLKVAWRNRFAEGGTEPRPFRTPSGPVDVPTMALTETLGYAAVDGWQVVRLPGAGQVEALVLLPDGDLAEAEATLTGESLAALVEAKGRAMITLRLPRLAVRSEAKLRSALSGLGVRAVFTDEADLSGISPDRLAVDEVVHEAVLKVDEQGFEGAAATAVMMRAVSLSVGEPLEVAVDRPFLFLVRNRRTGVLYFVARVTDPS
ncbi:Serine protease inhibitor (serpin family) [Actinokineospora spheciospongiae]|uniref:Serine protease inhibitor (Serpin family) n=1 Tax=Actinokineospora spheciospongiae TaxID=909613 RepID=W7IXU4_9PSEU|nr:serpin family protein [Actinokineospora spheciospongiae]EWC58874.1 Serine protease inhibitor (serpin family) [Actinokineospora spheciospongiae]